MNNVTYITMHIITCAVGITQQQEAGGASVVDKVDFTVSENAAYGQGVARPHTEMAAQQDINASTSGTVPMVVVKMISRTGYALNCIDYNQQ